MRKEQTAIITGAGSGLGRELSVALASAGYLVVLIDIDAERLAGVEEQIRGSGGRSRSVVVDIADEQDLTASFLGLELAGIDLLINCAGYSITATAEQLDSADWQRILQVNLLGLISLTTMVYRRMKQQGYGQIVNIASMFGLFPAPSGIAYATSKHGVVGFTRTLEIEAKDAGISVHLVCPGFIRTGFFENAHYVGVEKKTMLGQVPDNLLSAEEAAERILKGLARGKSLILFPFYVRLLWWVDWLFPRLAQKIWLGEMRKYRAIQER